VKTKMNELNVLDFERSYDAISYVNTANAENAGELYSDHAVPNAAKIKLFCFSPRLPRSLWDSLGKYIYQTQHQKIEV